jgi:hypothetical protein
MLRLCHQAIAIRAGGILKVARIERGISKQRGAE